MRAWHREKIKGLAIDFVCCPGKGSQSSANRRRFSVTWSSRRSDTTANRWLCHSSAIRRRQGSVLDYPAIINISGAKEGLISG